jgi:hypothetical protein
MILQLSSDVDLNMRRDVTTPEKIITVTETEISNLSNGSS